MYIGKQIHCNKFQPKQIISSATLFHAPLLTDGVIVIGIRYKELTGSGTFDAVPV